MKHDVVYVDLHNTSSGENYDDKALVKLYVDRKYVIMSRYRIPTN